MDWLAGTMLMTPVSVVLDCFRRLVVTDLRPDLARIDRPALIIHGDRYMSALLEITGRPTAAGITALNCGPSRGHHTGRSLPTSVGSTKT